jgi:hypothetical protein
MAITDISISEELMTNAPSIKYRGNEGPKSPQEIEEMIKMTSVDDPFYRPEYADDHALEMFGKPYKDLNADELEEFLEEMRRLMNKFSKGPVLPSDEDPINPFGPKPIGPPLPDRQMAAYGGIMGLDGRKQYGIGSWFQEKIMDPIKKNPVVSSVVGGALLNQFGIPFTGTAGDRVGQNWIGDLLGGRDAVLGSGGGDGKKLFNIGEFLETKKNKNDEKSATYGEVIRDAIGKNIIPAAGGIMAGLFTKNTESDTPGLPSDTTAMDLQNLTKTANLLDQKQGMAAGLNFLPAVSARKYSPEEMAITYAQAANGGRIGMAEGGLMDLGGMEKDYRAEGGFVPIGREEKADDVPARLSVNEFVFTADAVRNAGGGDIDKGAEVMENMMKHLEAGGQVSRESQGMAGARDMFEVSERLSEVV